MKCAVSPDNLTVSHFQPGTQCDTSATSLRKQKSKLPCKRPQIRGSAQGRALPPLREGRRIWRALRSPLKSLHG